MPSKRSSNAAQGRARKGRAQSPLTKTFKQDITGLILAIIAIAMCIALLDKSQAIITSGVRSALTYCFGAGALLVPIALFMFALTYFIERDEPVNWNIAIGLALIVVAILSLLSLNAPGVALAPDMVFTTPVLTKTGGYVGGGISYLLLILLGNIIGNVILVGFMIAGAVVCGFSISATVTRIRAKLGDAKAAALERAAQKRDQKAAESAARVENRTQVKARPQKAQPQTSLFDETGEGKTTYIGNRTQQLIKRNKPEEQSEDEALDDELIEEPKKERAAKRGKSKLKKEKREQDASSSDETTLLSPQAREMTQVMSAIAEDDEEAAAPTTLLPLTESKAQQKQAQKEAEASFAEALAHAEESRPGATDENYTLPSFDLLKPSKNNAITAMSDEDLTALAQKLQDTLTEFHLSATVEGWMVGPAVTTFKISMGEGERVSKIQNLQEDIALSLAAKSVRIFVPIPGTSYVGIEIPNDKIQPVAFADILPYCGDSGPLTCAFGRASTGKPMVYDLHKLPHLLVAGTTGSGKSVLLNSLIMSMLMRATPEQVRFIMIDPKRVEFTAYQGLPHLYVPVVTEPRQAASALQWATTEMERRFKMFQHYGVRDIETFNNQVRGNKFEDLENPPDTVPFFVIVIDELADLMMVAGKECEASIVRIAQLGRAAGMHLVVATQRPSADVVTGLIRANIDSRVALSVDNGTNSRIILDHKGAEMLLGKGDMLVRTRGVNLVRAQGCWVSDQEVKDVVAFIKTQKEADYHENILTEAQPLTPGAANAPSMGLDSAADDPLVWQAADIVVNSQLGSTSGIQRALSVGYARAGRIMDILEAKGVVGPANGSKPREVLMDQTRLQELKEAEAEFKEV